LGASNKVPLDENSTKKQTPTCESSVTARNFFAAKCGRPKRSIRFFFFLHKLQT